MLLSDQQTSHGGKTFRLTSITNEGHRSHQKTYYELNGVSETVFGALSARLEFPTKDVEIMQDDYIRCQMELCDRLDTIQAFMDTGDGFAHLGSKLLQYCRDEQPKVGMVMQDIYWRSPCVSTSIEAESGCMQSWQGQLVAQDVGRGMCYYDCLENARSDLIIPHEPDTWHATGTGILGGFNKKNLFEMTSAIGFAAHTLTYPYNIRSGLRRPKFLASDYWRSFNYKIAGALASYGNGSAVENLSRTCVSLDAHIDFATASCVATSQRQPSHDARVALYQTGATDYSEDWRKVIGEDVSSLIRYDIQQGNLIAVTARGYTKDHCTQLCSVMPNKLWHRFVHVDSTTPTLPLPFPQKKYVGADSGLLSIQTIVRRKPITDMSMLHTLQNLLSTGKIQNYSTYGLERDDVTEVVEGLRESQS